MELKEINVESILANFYQPRVKFDREGIQKLAESILSNGLINPITVREWKGNRYMIVSGERRWRAHKIANIKNIPVFVKEYKDELQFKVESMMENIHREDLTPTEKGKFCLEIKKDSGVKNNEQVANLLKISSDDVNNWIDDVKIRKTLLVGKNVPHTILRATRGFPDDERKKLIAFAEKKKMRTDDFEEGFIRGIYKQADEPTKKALLSGRISVEEAKKENVPEPIELEETINDTALEVNQILHKFSQLVDDMKKDNLNDLKKSIADKLMTTSGLHTKSFEELVNLLRQKGAKPHPLILALMKAKNGKR